MLIARAMYEFFENIVVRIESNTDSGTGFVIRNRDGVALIATAAHVVDTADKDGWPITLSNDRHLPPITLQKSERVILKNFSSSTGDTAIISIKPQILANFPQNDLPFIGGNPIMPIGDEVGWAGFPSSHYDTLCFFKGNISARVAGGRSAYLVDGTAVPGVSGGPAFRMDVRRVTDGGFFIIGVISQFYPFFTPRDATDKRKDSYPGLMQVESLDQVESLVAEMDRLAGRPPQRIIFG